MRKAPSVTSLRPPCYQGKAVNDHVRHGRRHLIRAVAEQARSKNSRTNIESFIFFVS